MQRQITDQKFLRAFARRILGRPSHALARATIAVHDRPDGLHVHIEFRHGDGIYFAWLNGHAFLLPGTLPSLLTVDDLFALEDALDLLIADLLRRHRIVDPSRRKEGAA